MPVQGRLTPVKPTAPLHSSGPPPAPGLGEALNRAIVRTQHAVAPAVRVAQQVVHSRADAASPTPQAARNLDLRTRLEAGVPAAAQRAQSRANERAAQGVQKRFAAEGQRGLREDAKAKAEGASPLNLGFINLTPAVSSLATLKVPGIGGVPGKLANELLDLPAQTFLSGAIAGSAAKNALHGNLQPVEQLGGSVLSQIKDPVGSFEQAPLSTALLFAGGEDALGTLGGKLARTGVLGDRAAQLASTVRPDLQLGGAEHIPLRSYNKDPLRKAGQVAYEKALTKLPGDLRQADPNVAQGWRLQRHLVGGPLKVGQVDKIASAGEDTRRTLVKGSAARMAELHPEHGIAEHLVPLAVQRVLRSPATFEHDLQLVKAQWEAAQPGLKGSALKANRINLAHVDAALASPALLEHPDLVFSAAKGVEALQKPVTAALVHGGKLRPEQLKASLFPYAQTHLGAVHDGAGLVGPDGAPLTTPAILAHLEQQGLEPPGYLSHRVGVRGRSSFYKPVTKLPALERFGRTGASFAKGTADHSWEALVGTVARQASEAAQLQIRPRVLSRLGIGAKGEKGATFFPDSRAAQAAADNFHATPEGAAVAGKLGEVVPVHVGSQQIVEKGAIRPQSNASDVLAQYGLAEHTPVGADANGKYVLMHRGVLDRLQAHDSALRSTTDGGLFLQQYQKLFRKAKLNTSVPHIAGVMQEQGIRLSAEGVAPGAHVPEKVTIAGRTVKVPVFGGRDVGGFAGRAGAKIDRSLAELAQIDTHTRQLAADWGPEGDKFREISSAVANRGGLAGAQRATDAVRKSDQLHSEVLAHVWGGAEAAARSRAAAPVAKVAHVWAAVIEGGLAHVEHSTRNALLAKAMKDSGLISSYRSVNKAMDAGVKTLLEGKMTPQVADALAAKIDEMGGNWNRQTPMVRTVVGKFAPFGLWWLNSMHWLLRMPITHPIKTGIAGALYQATREQRGKEGQGFDAAHPVPAFLQGSIPATLPLVGKATVDPTHYSPGGTLGPEALTTAVEQFVPALKGVIGGAEGVNPLTKRELTDQHGKPLTVLEKLLNVGAEGLSGPLPLATQAQKQLEMGGKPYGTANLLTDLAHVLGVGPSQVKPGTERSEGEVLAKDISPLRFNFPSSTAGSGVEASPRVQHRIQQAEKRAEEYEKSPRIQHRIEEAEKRAARTGG